MNIKDIAKLSGYGIGTVSRVLNNKPNVSSKAREEILKIAKEHNFIRNSNAQMLKQQGTSIAILVKGVSNILLSNILELIQKILLDSEYTTSVTVLDESENEAKAAYRVYYSKKPAGIIFLGGSPEYFKDDFDKIKVPCVLITSQGKNINSDYLSSVSTDDVAAAKKMTEYLISCGHKKIAVIGGQLSDNVVSISERRYKGFLSAMKKHHLSFDQEKYYHSSKYSFDGGMLAAEELLNKTNDFTAVFAMSDVQALGAIRYFADKGYKVPEDISVSGFDGLPITQFTNPRLTTIKQISDRLAREGTKSLLNSLVNGTVAVHKLIPFELVEGESVKKI